MAESVVSSGETSLTPDFGGGDAVQFSTQGALAVICLSRPRALNALTHQMVLAITKALLYWAEQPFVKAVLMKGEGRAFCAGGDVVAAYHAGKNGTPALDFFKDEYRLNQLISQYNKPYIALMDGITMGGGAGLSIHGQYRIVTENTAFAMPESGIGFFTDVGASAFLPLLPDHFGLYLGLSGHTIGWGDCLQSGLASHAVYHAQIPQLLERLAAGEAAAAIFNDAPAGFFASPDWETCIIERALISRCCAGEHLADVLAGFRQAALAGDAAAQRIMAVLERRSPTSLQAIFTLLQDSAAFIRANAALGYSARLERQLKIEYALAQILLARPDFYSGVKAVLIDKTGMPQWQPASLAQVQLPDFTRLADA